MMAVSDMQIVGDLLAVPQDEQICRPRLHENYFSSFLRERYLPSPPHGNSH